MFWSPKLFTATFLKIALLIKTTNVKGSSFDAIAQIVIVGYTELYT